MPGIDKPTRRVVALLVLLLLAAAALRGYLPSQGRTGPTEPGGGRAALVFIVVLLGAALALLTVAVIARLRDPRAVAPNQGELSQMLGTDKFRPNWRVVLIGLAVIAAWLLIMTLVVRYLVPHGVPDSSPAPAPSAATPSAHPGAPPARQRPRNGSGDMLGILVAATIPMLVLIVAGSVILSRRRWRATPPAVTGDHVDEHPGPPAPGAESLARAAELGLAEIGDLNREPRDAIIACYAAMERELANVPAAAPQEFDTPTEVLVRAVEQRALHADNAEQLVNLFEEARFSPHVMNEGHRDVAEHVLRLVLAELRSTV